MKVLSRLILFVALLSVAAPAVANNFRFHRFFNGRSWFLNGDNNVNDGWWYVQNHCGGFVRHSRFFQQQAFSNLGYGNVAYSKDWKERIVEGMNRQQENQDFQQAIQTVYGRGYSGNGYGMPGMQYGNYVRSGITATQQGFGSGGSTHYATAGQSANPLEILQALAAISMEDRQNYRRDQELSTKKYGYMLGGSRELTYSMEQVAKLQALDQLARTTLSATPQQTTVQQWSERQVPPQYQEPQQQYQQPQEADPRDDPQYRTQDEPPAEPRPEDGASDQRRRETYRMALGGEMLVRRQCVDCHSGEKLANSNVDLSHEMVRNLDREARQSLAQSAINHMQIPEGQEGHMPKGKPSLPEKFQREIAVYLSGMAEES